MGMKRQKWVRGLRVGGFVEWVGGRFAAPLFVKGEEPYRPGIVLWLELPSDFMVGMSLGDPSVPEVPFAETLRRAMEAPAVGKPRRPDRVRVADGRLAAEVREAFPEIEVVVRPAPELDRALEDLAQALPNRTEELSYLEEGRISPEVLRKLFISARALWAAAPWKKAGDGQLLRVDVPRFGVHGGCLSIIGALGESLGFLIFPTLQGYEAFERAAESLPPPGTPIDLGTTILGLTFSRGADLSDRMRREVAAHGWPVAGPDAYPTVEHRERDGYPRPLTEKDVRIAGAVAASLAPFFFKHGSLFDKPTIEPICESWFDEEDLEVRFTAPYEAGPHFVANAPSPAGRERGNAGPSRPKVSRNAPCPCGSGKKYKKCCLEKEKEVEAAERIPASLHEMDERLAVEIFRFAARKFRGEWSLEDRAFRRADEAIGLSAPWSVYSASIRGKTAAEWYAEEHRSALSKDDREWLDAQRQAWLSIWEVEVVVPGKEMRLRDLLTGEVRLVAEKSATADLAVRDALLARAVDCRGCSVLCGMHPRPLPPREADAVASRVRKRLRRKDAVPADRLREEETGRFLIRRWEEAVEDLDRRVALPPRLANTDGEELLFTVDHFDFDPKDRSAIEEKLGSLEGAEASEEEEEERAIHFVRPSRGEKGLDGGTLLGKAALGPRGRMRLETNSRERADSLRRRVESACGDLLRHRLREHADPRAGFEKALAEPPPAEIPLPAEAAGILREFKERHYREWLDLPVPALGGRTPREAARTEEGRKSALLLLKEMEHMENRLPTEERFDFSAVRRALGLE